MGRATSSWLGWRSWFLAALGLNAVFLLVRAGQRCSGSDLHALAATISDDSYYYLLPAFRFWESGYWTFDGEHPTYGVQPAYAWFLTLLAAGFDERFAFFRTALWTNYALFAATAVGIGAFLYRLLRPYGAFRAGLAALVGAHGFLLDGTLLHAYTTLKENSLYAPLLVASLLLTHHARGREGWRALLACGFVTGLAISCRLTPSTLLVAATTGMFAARGGRPRRLLALAGGALLAVLPWATHALVVHGRLLPTSGAVKLQPFVEAVRNGTYGARAPELLAEVGPYLGDVFAYSLGQPSRFFLPQGDPVRSVVTAAFPFLLLGLVLVFRRGHALRACQGAVLVPAAIAAATLGTALNPLLLGLERMHEVRAYYTWYLADLPVLLAILAPLSVCFVGREPRAEEAVDVSGVTGPGATLAAVLAALLVLAGFSAFGQLRVLGALQPREGSWGTQMVAIAERANELVEPEARIGAYNSGVLGFLCTVPVVNFDGLANDDILQARARGTTQLEYVRANRIRYLIDPLRPAGWFDNPFDRVEIAAAVPFHLAPPSAYYDGYFLLRVVEERFPDFEPRVAGRGVRVVPWQALDPLGSAGMAVRGFRFEPSDGPAVLTFRTVRFYSGLSFLYGSESGAPVDATLTLRDEAGRVLFQGTPGRSERASLACAGVDVLAVEVAVEVAPRAPGAPAPVVWLTSVAFDAAPLAGDEPVLLTYGEGCDARAQPSDHPPRLEAEGDPATGKLRFRCTHAPPQAVGMLAIGSAPVSRPLDGGCRALVERTSSTIYLQLTTDEAGRVEKDVTLPPDAPAGFRYAQVVFRDPDDPRRFSAATNGVRILVP